MTARDLLLGVGGVFSSPYVEDVFNTYLYTGNGSSQTITNGIDLADNGGMVWIKTRNVSSTHYLFDTARGIGNYISSNTTLAQSSDNQTLNSFNSNGFGLGDDANSRGTNILNQKQVAWTFSRAPKFFDVVTYTGNGSTQKIRHGLGIKPGMIFVKNINTGGTNWYVYNVETTANGGLSLNDTSAFVANSNYWNSTEPTVNVFSVGNFNGTNASGQSYVAYLFANDTSANGVIICGDMIDSGSGLGGTVALGWQPQYVLMKRYDSTGDWQVFDTMRGLVEDDVSFTTANAQDIHPNNSNVETSVSNVITLTETGFSYKIGAGAKAIYMAIRRGPMRTPTDGTTVFSPIAVNAATGTQQTTGFPVDMQLAAIRAGNSTNTATSTRIIGVDTNGSMNSDYLVTSNSSPEATGSFASRTNSWNNTGFKIASSYNLTNSIFWNFQRAPNFFDSVNYNGTGTNRSVSHTLKAIPELMIIKERGPASSSWFAYNSDLGANKYITVNENFAAVSDSIIWNNTAPTSVYLTVGDTTPVNSFGSTYIAYLFASCPGVSKVGSYTGTGSSQNINCGFTTGSRFVLIKRTDSTGDWYVWDSARGITSGNDPYILLNSTAAETTGTDYINQISSGFTITSSAPAAINASGGSYIFLAIA